MDDHAPEDVWWWRYRTARRAGLSRQEARELADREVSAVEIRRLAALECPPDLIARILAT